MRKYIFIGIGGVAGALSRYIIKGIHINHYNGIFPINTLFINITGSFILASILTLAFEIWEFDSDIRLGIATGFLGAYTTFSTLCKETVELMKQGYFMEAFLTIASSVIAGLAAIYIGVILGRKVFPKFFKKKKFI